jgi:hypothetical protein
MDLDRELIRHYLAALAYRTQKALRGAPSTFGDFRAGENVRTPRELVWHMTGVIGYARTVFRGGVWQPDGFETLEEEVARFHEVLADLSELVASGAPILDGTIEQLLQGPLSDAMTHAGQLALLRRLAGSPVRPENFLRARVSADNVSASQAEPVAPNENWSPDQPPPSPGRWTRHE